MKQKRLKFLLFLGGIVAIANAQQLPNYGFDNWKTECASTESLGDTEGMRQRPGVEPSDWNGSSVNQKVSGVTKEQALIYNDNGAVKMENTYVGINLFITKIGSVAPGFITLGTPWVYATTKVKECNGGTYGGVSFSYKPDAITGRYKRTDSTGENSYIIAYLWNGTFTANVGSASSPSTPRDNTEYAILGKTTPTASGTLVASCNYAFTSTNGDWQTITVPLDYTGTTSAPTMMNVIISGGNYWDRSNLKEGTTLIADDIRYVYYSTLKTLSYDNTALTIPAAGGTIDLSSIDYDAAKLAYTLNGQTANATTSYDEENALLTIVVSNVDADIDGQSSHTYYIQFAQKKHTHNAFIYEANENVITAYCGECKEALGTISISVPSNLVYDGTAKQATLTNSIPELNEPAIVYSCGEAPINAGSYTASITVGDATATVAFVITPKEIAEEEVEVSGINGTYDYTGEAIELDITVKIGDVLLAEGVDYTVSYSNNVEEGMAEVTINLIGNYSGTTTYTFEIVKEEETEDTEDTNGILTTPSRESMKVYYDLHGRRVNEPIKGHLYIVNGKKVIF